MIRFFCLTFVIMSFFSFNISFAYDGNKTIESFNKSKKILRNIHKENPVTFYCQCSYKKKSPEWKSCGFKPRKDKKRASRIEWEHILPASHFGIKFDTWKNGHASCKSSNGKKYKGRKCTEKVHKLYRKMQADLYNLQPAIGEVNGLRSNYQIAIIKGESREFGKCDIEIQNKKVEPSEIIRGDIARTYMYMEQNYPKYITFNNSIKNLINKWDKDDPVDDWECLRANKIYKIQRNLNHIIHERCNKEKDVINKKNKESNKIVNKKIKISKEVNSKKNKIQVNGSSEEPKLELNEKNNNSKTGSYIGEGSSHALK